MLYRGWRAAALALALYTGVAAVVCGEAKAVISGPATAQAGDLVVLSGEGSTGTKLKWLLANSNKTFLALNGKCAFAARQPGRYVFILVAADGKAEVDIATHELTLTDDAPGPTPPVPPPVPPGPTPPTPPPPNPVTLADKCHAWVVAVPEAERLRCAEQVALRFEGIAKEIEDGDLRSENAVVAATKQAITTALPMPDRLAWRTFGEKLMAELQALDTAGHLPDLADNAKAFRAIAVGIRRALPKQTRKAG